MINLTNSTIVEDRYIAHMAGLNAGQKPIGYSDKSNASKAQKHPVGNAISAVIVGPIKGVAVATFGLLASPFLNSTSRASIVGSTLKVCSSCGINMKTTMEILQKAAEILDPREGLSFFEQKLNAYGIGFVAAGECTANEEMLMKCRAFNYAGSIVDTLVNNYTVVAAATLGLAALYTYSKMSSYGENECKTEEAMNKDLTSRFKKIATRLSSFEPNQTAKDCASKILQRQFEINNEVFELELPNLTWEGVEEMTQPVFDAAVRLKEAKYEGRPS